MPRFTLHESDWSLADDNKTVEAYTVAGAVELAMMQYVKEDNQIDGIFLCIHDENMKQIGYADVDVVRSSHPGDPKLAFIVDITLIED